MHEQDLKVLILGSGAREHALAWKIAQSPLVSSVTVAPGNVGIARFFQVAALKLNQFESIAQFIQEKEIDLVVIGPEQPLVDGLVDFLRQHSHPLVQNVHLIGPNKACAALEGSKDFSKTIMQEAGIPTAASQTFTASEHAELEAYLSARKPPYVIKADGLAAGKGVAICSSLKEALSFSHEILVDNVFGQEQASLLVEDFLEGIEVSLFVLTDGKHYQWLPEAKDYKRIFDQDQGPNTGGMGSVSPVWFADADFYKKVEDRILNPLFKTLNYKGLTYQGFLFLGLMNVKGEPFVIEFNARLGDPETQSLMMRLESDLVPALLALKGQKLNEFTLKIRKEAACTIVAAAENYPGEPLRGDKIELPDTLPSGVEIFFAGVSGSCDQLLTAGGRVLTLSAIGASLEEARQQAYAGINSLCFRGMQYRQDIGLDVINGQDT